MKRLLSLVIMIWVLVSGYSEAYVSKIEVNGLRKTKESFVQGVLEKYLNSKESELKINSVETDLQCLDLFSDVEVVLKNNDGTARTAENITDSEELILSINVKEKITFIPLPFISYSSSGLMGGFMLMNMNAFGKKNMLVTGGIFSNSMQMGMITCSKPAGSHFKPGFSFFTSFSHKDTDITDYEKNDIMNFEYYAVSSAFNVTEKLNKYISMTAGARYNFNYDIDDNLSNHLWSGSLNASVSDTKWNGWYLISNSFSVTGEAGADQDGNFVNELKSGFDVQTAVIPRLRLGFKGSGTISNDKAIILKPDRKDAGATIIGSNFKTDKICGFTANAEGAIAKSKVGTISLYGTYEYNMAQSLDDEFLYSHGPGLGLKVYMKQIAFPAVLLGGSYNVNQNNFFFVASVGMSF